MSKVPKSQEYVRLTNALLDLGLKVQPSLGEIAGFGPAVQSAETGDEVLPEDLNEEQVALLLKLMALEGAHFDEPEEAASAEAYLAGIDLIA